jgi:TolB protein
LTFHEPNPRREEDLSATNPERERSGRPREGKGRWAIRLTPMSLLLPMLLVLLVVYLLTADHSEGVQPTNQPPPATPTSAATPTPFAPATVPATMGPASGLDLSEFDELLVRAEQLARQSRFDEAISLYEELASQASEEEEVRIEVGWAWALVLDGRSDQALVHAQRAAELEDDNAEALRILARAYLEIGGAQTALEVAQRAAQLEPTSADGQAVLAEAYLLNGRPEDALEHAQRALALGSDNAEAHRIRAKLYDVVEGNTGQALQALRTAAELEPELWSRHHELGLLLLRVGDYRATTVSLKNALALRAKPETYTALGEAYYWLKEYDRASAFLQQALSAGTQNATTYALLAAASAQQGDCEDAQLFWEQALDREPDNRLAVDVKGWCQGEEPVAGAATVDLATPWPTQPVAEIALRGWIAFPVWSSERGQYDTYVTRADGSDRRLVQEGMHQPAFSPDGQWLALNGERQNYESLFVSRSDGGELRGITAYVEDGLPCWSPDGMGLAFSSTRHGDRRSRVYVLDQLPAAGQQAEGRALFSDQRDILGEFPAWTAAGQIVYNSCEYRGAEVGCGLFTISAQAGPQTPQLLTSHPEDTAPAAHQGRISFMSTRDGNWEIYVMNDDGFGLRRLTFDAAHDGLPAWSPDGRSIAFVSNRSGAWAVWAMGADGSDPRKLFDIGGEGLGPTWYQERISWAP